MKPISSWGRVMSPPHHTIFLDDPFRARNIIIQRDSIDLLSGQENIQQGLPYGMGRSYGDSCLNPHGTLWLTRGLNRFISLNEQTGGLVCEAGISFKEIQQCIVPRGWILPVNPGTQLITVGGAIANDIHGKNHHVRGSFGNHVQRLKLARTNGEIIECGPTLRSDWFQATVGGLGLTGLILEAEIQLQPIDGPWLETETIAFSSLDDFLSLSAESEVDWEYTVSWVDCISARGQRGLFMRGRPISSSEALDRNKSRKREEPQGRKLSVPFVPPISLVNRFSLRLFNITYYHLKKWKAYRDPCITHYEPFFYPLDNLLEWNRIYGPKGFFQHQSVVPQEAHEAIEEMLSEVARSGDGSFLAVLKTLGHHSPVGMLSFPKPGITLALDFPNKGEATLKLLKRIDHIVREAGGRIYPAKDMRMPKDLFESGYPKLNEFLKYRDSRISSGFSRRIMGS